jgi:hypothetical protein
MANVALGWDGADVEGADKGTANKCMLSPWCGESLFRYILWICQPVQHHTCIRTGAWGGLTFRDSERLL